MKKLHLGVIAMIVILGGALIFKQAESDQAEDMPAEGTPAETAGQDHENTESENDATAQETAHPVSIQALAAKQYDGRDLTVGQVLESNPAYTRYYITYKSGELTISGIMNVPAGSGPFPVLFLNHGYIDPAVYTNGRGLRREQDYLARRGYVVIHSDYRNHAQSDKDPDTDVNFRLGYAEDVINAVYAVKNSDLPYFAKDKIGMMGHSMGGGVTQNIIVSQPDLVGAAVLYAPVSADNYDNFLRWTTTRPETAQRVTAEYGSPETNPEFWRNISAINFLDKVETPVMIQHGTADDSVPIEWSDRMNRMLTEAGKDVTYHVYPGEPHEFAAAWSQFMQRSADFYNTHLK